MLWWNNDCFLITLIKGTYYQIYQNLEISAVGDSRFLIETAYNLNTIECGLKCNLNPSCSLVQMNSSVCKLYRLLASKCVVNSSHSNIAILKG